MAKEYIEKSEFREVLIDANSAKSSILVVADCMTVDCDWLDGYKTGLLAATDAIDEIPTIDPAPQWIPVTERLPEPEQDVILCTREIETYGKHHEKKKIYRNIYMGYFDGDEWLTIYCHGCEYIFKMNEKYPNETIDVTHWMPLPEPPEDGGAE